MKNTIFLAFAILIFSITSVFAQQTPKTISGGVVNGKAQTLPKPVYPKEAGRLRIGGSVSVQVLIDEEGNVVSANAISGHPMLHEVSEEAARRAKFLPTTLEGQPVKVAGIITYVYNMNISFLRIGYELAFAEKSSTAPEYFFSDLIQSNLPKDWTEERKTVRNLGIYFRSQKAGEVEEKEMAEKLKVEENAVGIDKNSQGGKIRTIGTITAVTSRDTPRIGTEMPDIENLNPTKTLQDLQSDIRSRLSSDKKQLWFFRFGILLANLDVGINDEDKLRTNIYELESLIEEVPGEVPQAVVVNAKSIVNFVRTSAMNKENQTKLVEYIRNFQRSRVD